MGSAKQVMIIADFIRTIKKYKPETLYLCDPVMGDTDKGQYVEPDVPNAIIEHLVPLADLLTPNQFEAERIINKQIGDVENIALSLREQFDLTKHKNIITGGALKGRRQAVIYNGM